VTILLKDKRSDTTARGGAAAEVRNATTTSELVLQRTRTPFADRNEKSLKTSALDSAGGCHLIHRLSFAHHQTPKILSPL
jgi:hypothetical protein